MHDIHPVETILARLMPSALSEGGRQEIEEMIDELSKSATVSSTGPVRGSLLRLRIIGSGIAAAGVAAALVFPILNHPGHVIANTPLAQADPGFVLVGESDRVESMIDEGWLEDSDGSTMQAMRINVVAENTLRDEKTGILMSISEPREELLLMPISTF